MDPGSIRPIIEVMVGFLIGWMSVILPIVVILVI